MSDQKNQKNNTDLLLEKIAIDSDLKEGKEAIKLILREIYRNGTIGTKQLARRLFIPVPIIAAVRKELEKEELLARNNRGAILTEKGINLVESSLGIRYTKDLKCSICSGSGLELPIEAEDLIQKQKEFSEKRPKPLTELDQAFGKPITAISRAYMLLQNNDLEGKNILLLGDDDFTSLAIGLLKTSAKVTVLDIDQRLLDLIAQISEEYGFNINCLQADFREQIPANLIGKFDTIFTDPPYTIPGLKLFLSRALQLLKKESNKKIYLAFVHKPPLEQLAIQELIVSMGLAIQELIPGFNLYEGAEMHGNTTYLCILATTEKTQILVEKEFSRKIYTGEVNPTIRQYQCKNGHVIKIGMSEEIKTIEDLKEIGCPLCHAKTDFIRISREKI
ncbi:MAG: bis-aminopropyl spermidine synthase family protein [Candidatus Thorarchaeota archaeon]